MAMTQRIEPQLQPVMIKELRPTQMTVGLREVESKRADWRQRATADGPTFLGHHMIPVVIGPKERFWLIDHHHLARALYDEGVEHVLVTIVAQLHHLKKPQFLTFMDNRNWLHTYDECGRRRQWQDLPEHVGELADDPYRSLAGEVRRNGGFAKTETPYSEFLWADFFRSRISANSVTKKFERAVRDATLIARSHSASYLPGFAGITGSVDHASPNED